MHSTQAIVGTADRRAVVIDLIGDLDTTLGSVVGETLERIVGAGAAAILISTRHIAQSTRDGLARLDAAVVRARAGGCAISVDAGNRRMRTALAFARISYERTETKPPNRRHVMIAHSATSEPVRKDS